MKAHKQHLTGANRENGERNLCSLRIRTLLFKSGRDTASPYIDSPPLLVATKPELGEDKAVYVLSDAEIGLFSDEVVVKYTP